MDSYRLVEEFEYFPPESEELLKDDSPADSKRSQHGASIRRNLVSASLGLLGCLELIFLLIILLRGDENNKISDLLGELNGIVPEFPPKAVLFRPDPLATSDHITADSINATEENWLTYMPKGNGFVILNDNKKYQLPPPMEKSGERIYSLAVTHQLHCLYSIMRTFDDFIGENQINSERNEYKHIDHCFRYLRQSLLCCGDTAFEGQDPNTTLPATDGTGAIHICKDYDAILSWAEGQSVTDKKHI